MTNCYIHQSGGFAFFAALLKAWSPWAIFKRPSSCGVLDSVAGRHFLSPSFFQSVSPLDLSFLPLLRSLLFSLSSVLAPLPGISGSISFKAHVKGTVCCFKRPLCPAFLPPNLVSPKHFPIARLSRPFSLPPQLPLSTLLSLPISSPTVLNTFFGFVSFFLLGVKSIKSACQWTKTVFEEKVKTKAIR